MRANVFDHQLQLFVSADSKSFQILHYEKESRENHTKIVIARATLPHFPQPRPEPPTTSNHFRQMPHRSDWCWPERGVKVQYPLSGWGIVFR